jgi:hypothetical protein
MDDTSVNINFQVSKSQLVVVIVLLSKPSSEGQLRLKAEVEERK